MIPVSSIDRYQQYRAVRILGTYVVFGSDTGFLGHLVTAAKWQQPRGG